MTENYPRQDIVERLEEHADEEATKLGGPCLETFLMLKAAQEIRQLRQKYHLLLLEASKREGRLPSV